jgi:hypothetical protein
LENVMIDHRKATRHRTACRYVLGELAAPERAEFEAHFFECAECAEEVRALLAISLSADTIPPDAPDQEVPAAAAGSRLFGRFEPFLLRPPRPAFMMVPMLVLLVSTAITTREWMALRKRLAAQAVAEFNLRPNTRGEEPAITTTGPSTFFILAADVPGAVHDLKWRIRPAESVASILEGTAPLPSTGSSLRLLIPASKCRSGAYVLSIRENVVSTAAPTELVYSFRMH